MKVCLIIVCQIFALINGDAKVNIVSEEENRYNATVAQYFKAVINGALNTLFPEVTDKEISEAEKLFSDVYPLGDPSRPLADSEQNIEVNLCRNHRERGNTLLTYARKRWPIHLLTQVSFRLGINAIGDKNDWYCNDAANRNIYTSNATVINSYVKELNAVRNKYIDNNIVVIHGNITNKLAIICCSFWDFKAHSIKAVQNPNTKHFLDDYISGYSGPALNYLCIYYSEGSKACDNLVIPPSPANTARPTSSLDAITQAILKITSL